MKESSYEQILKNWLNKAENKMENKSNQKVPVRRRFFDNDLDSMDKTSSVQYKHAPRNQNFSNHNRYRNQSPQNNRYRNQSPQNKHSKPNQNISGDVREAVENLFCKHSANVNSKLNTILQKVNNFSSEVDKLKAQNEELQERNIILMQLLLEKEGLKDKDSASRKGNLNETSSLSPTPNNSPAPAAPKNERPLKKVAHNKQSVMNKPAATSSKEAVVVTKYRSGPLSESTHANSLPKTRSSSASSAEFSDAEDIPGPSGEGFGFCSTKYSIPGKEPMSEYDQLLLLAEEKIIYAQDPFICDECNQNFIKCKKGDGVMLKNCNHTYCKECIRKHILKNTDLGSIHCLQEDCEFSILESEIESLLTRKEYEVRSYHAIRKIKESMENPIKCVTKGCGNIVDVGENVHDFTCPLCKNVNCLDCKKIHADGTTCRKLADLTLEVSSDYDSDE